MTQYREQRKVDLTKINTPIAKEVIDVEFNVKNRNFNCKREGKSAMKPRTNEEENKRGSQSLAHNLSSYNGGGINQVEAQMGEEQEPRPHHRY
ncbi:hypothetical protein SLE2022_139030 [Rubroshorea leprosula]